MIGTYAIKDTAGMSPDELAARSKVAAELIAAGIPVEESLIMAQLAEPTVRLDIPRDVRVRMMAEVKTAVTETVERVLREMQEEKEAELEEVEKATEIEPPEEPQEPITQDQDQDGHVVQPVPDIEKADTKPPAGASEEKVPPIEAKPAGKEDGTTRIINKDEKRIPKPSTPRRGGRR